VETVCPTSKLRASAILLLIVENYIQEVWATVRCHFIKIGQLFKCRKGGQAATDGRTDNMANGYYIAPTVLTAGGQVGQN
jgi:hypothetical protein